MSADAGEPFGPQPWRGLSAEVAGLIEPELDAIAAETLRAIASEVPEYARPFEGSFGRGIRRGVEEALRQFVALIRDPDGGRGVGREVYVALGRGELRQGRTLDSLQAAYRVGARVAWRRISAAGRRAALDAEELSLLAEAIFAYIDELAADAVEGYAEARAEAEDIRRSRRRELAALLVGEPAASEEDARAAAKAAGWELPRRAAAICCRERDLAAIARRLPSDALDAVVEGRGCLIVPDPDGPGRPQEVARAVPGDANAAIGPAGAPSDLAASWAPARLAAGAMEDGALAGGGLLRVEDRAADLLVLGGAPLVRRVADARLAGLDGLTPRASSRMEETALAYVRHAGNSVAMARELDVHPQTVRYRVGRLRELLGDQLDDADARFELEAALRGRALSRAGSAAGS